jgi:hypothetical protein
MKVYYHEDANLGEAVHFATSSEAIASAKESAEYYSAAVTVTVMDVAVDAATMLKALGGGGYASNIREFAVCHSDGTVERIKSTSTGA